MIYKASPIFNHVHPIIPKATFSFPIFVSAHAKNQPNSSIQIQQILESQDLKDHAHF